MNTDLMFSSTTPEWSTPQNLFDELNREFNFKIDVCANSTNKKCRKYFTSQQDGLLQEWNETFWCNPPYGKETVKWVKKAIEQCALHDVTGVLLVASRTDVKWFHDHLYNKPNIELRFLKGRLKFGGQKDPAPFPSLVVVINKKYEERYSQGI